MRLPRRKRVHHNAGLPAELAEAGDAIKPPQDGIDLFVDQNDQHIAREEQELPPMAERRLEPRALNRIGQSMLQRRGVRLR